MGIVFYECITGKTRPETPIRDLITGVAPFIPEDRKASYSSVAVLYDACTKKNPNDRPSIASLLSLLGKQKNERKKEDEERRKQQEQVENQFKEKEKAKESRTVGGFFSFFFDFFHKLRNTLAINKKKDYITLLENDNTVQLAYNKFYKREESLFVGKDKLIATGFLDRYIHVETIMKILFSIDQETKSLYDVLDRAEDIKFKETFPIRLYIAEPTEEIKTTVSPTLGWLEKQNFPFLYGSHVALQIGDKLVHFLDNHFVKIDTFKASSALQLIYISKSGRLPYTGQIQKIIAERIVKWNKTKFYDYRYRNFGDFVEDICNSLNPHLKEGDMLDLSFSSRPEMQQYLSNLVKNPKTYATFGFNFEGGFITFETHNQLDEWETVNYNKLSFNQQQFLKGFHRAFQLRYAAASALNDLELSKKYEPNPYSGCSRGNPTVL